MNQHIFYENMYSTFIFQFTTAILLLLTLYTNYYNQRVLADSTLRCATNFYEDGNDCKECPAGYYGDNCSNVCPLSYYGHMCGNKCECLPCHYIYGCVSTTLIHVAETSFPKETKDEIKDTNQIPETTSLECKNEDKTKCLKQTLGNMKTSDRILIISVGSLLCVMLILAIIREICLCCRFPQSAGRRTTRDDVYADIVEMQNERTLTE